jgi:hypothetical protein
MDSTSRRAEAGAASKLAASRAKAAEYTPSTIANTASEPPVSNKSSIQGSKSRAQDQGELEDGHGTSYDTLERAPWAGLEPCAATPSAGGR